MEDQACIIGLVYDAVTDSRRWAQVLQELRLRLDATAAAWFDHDFERNEGGIIHADGYGPEYIRLYAEVYAPLNVWLQADLDEWYKPGRISLGEEIIATEQLIKTRFYREWLEPQHIFYRICATVKRENHRIFYLEAMRPRSEGSFGSSEIDLLRGLIPHLQRALGHSHHSWQLAVALDMLAGLPFAVVAVDKQGRPLLMNSVAKEVLAAQKDLCFTPERLSAARADIAARLSALIASAATYSAPNGNERQWQKRQWKR